MEGMIVTAVIAVGVTKAVRGRLVSIPRAIDRPGNDVGKEVEGMKRFAIPRTAHCNEGHINGPGQDRKLSSIYFCRMSPRGKEEWDG